MQQKNFSFLAQKEAQHVYDWFSDHDLDWSSVDSFIKGRQVEKIRNKDFHHEFTEDYARLNYAEIINTIFQLIKDFDKECTELMIIPARGNQFFASGSEEPAVIELSRLPDFVESECLIFTEEYFLTSPSMDWWILLPDTEEIIIWKSQWS